jgi:hypothetical protein
MRVLLKGAAVSVACLASACAGAVDIDVGDYNAAPVGTNMAAWYQQYGHSSRFDPDGGLSQRGATGLSSNVGILRLIHFGQIGGFTIDPQVLLPVGHLYNAQVGGQSMGHASGMGDAIVGATLWLVNQPDAGASGRYLGVTYLLTVPTGHYDKGSALNMGANRYQHDLQIGWVQPLQGKLGLEVYGDAIVYGNNDDAGDGRQRLEQDATYQVQTNLRYDFNPASRVALGYSASAGGKQFLDDVYTGQKTQVQQVRLEYQQMALKNLQLSAQLTHDTHVVGGFHEDVGVNLRALLLF